MWKTSAAESCTKESKMDYEAIREFIHEEAKKQGGFEKLSKNERSLLGDITTTFVILADIQQEKKRSLHYSMKTP